MPALSGTVRIFIWHMSDVIANRYANNRGLEPIKVSINAA